MREGNGGEVVIDSSHYRVNNVLGDRWCPSRGKEFDYLYSDLKYSR